MSYFKEFGLLSARGKIIVKQVYCALQDMGQLHCGIGELGQFCGDTEWLIVP